MEPEILLQWTQEVNNHNLKNVLALYSKEAYLLPTLSKLIRADKEGIKDYFTHFLAKNNLKVAINSCAVRKHKHIRIDSGVYTFTWKENEEPKSAEARFTFVIENDKIVEHHSSLMPS